MKKIISRFLMIFLLLSMIGCAAPNISPKNYSNNSVGQVNRTVAAIVISVREVAISGTTSLGAGSGSAIGAVAGSSLGGSGRDNLAGAIGGALIGGIAGAAIESNATKQMGVEYVVETINGNMMTIVQGSDPLFKIGSKVLVLYGNPSRIIVDPR